jgi:ABC-type transport system involved in multi-copper enzyme maturation permease subunit
MTAEAMPQDPPEFPVRREPSELATLGASVAAVLKKESRWRMRGRRAFVIVTVYLTALALLVLFVYQTLYERAIFDAQFGADPFGRGGFVGAPNGALGFVPGAVSAGIGQAIFIAILILQTVLVVILAPALTSGAISSEREKQTLELLITTPVSTLGMVTGKLVSSLAFVLLLILASVPLMSAVFAFGGIAPEDLLKAYVILFAAAFSLGSIGLFMSALIKRSQLATALSYLVVLALVLGSVIVHTWWYASSDDDPIFGGPGQRSAPDALLWFNPFVADVDLLCTAMPDPFGGSCGYTGVLTGQEIDPSNPPRDAWWPRSVAAQILVGFGLLLLSTQLIAPSRRWRRLRKRPPPPPRSDAHMLDGVTAGP